jgi:hypothetical protein
LNFSERYVILWVGCVIGLGWDFTLFTDDKRINLTILSIILLAIAGGIEYLEYKHGDNNSDPRR